VLAAVAAIRTVISGGALPSLPSPIDFPRWTEGWSDPSLCPSCSFLRPSGDHDRRSFLRLLIFMTTGPFRYLGLLALPLGVVTDILQFGARKKRFGGYDGGYIGGGGYGGLVGADLVAGGSVDSRRVKRGGGASGGW